MSISRKYY